MLDICFVHLKPVRPEKADFATIVPLRMAKLLGSEVRLHVVYMGTINEDKLERKGVRTYRYDGVLAENRWTRYVGLTKFIADVLRRQDVDVAQNVWFHFGLFPLKAAGLVADVPVLARIAGEPISVAKLNDLLEWTRNRLGLVIERVSLALADHIHVLSSKLSETFTRRGISPDRMSVISQGCDTEMFVPLRSEEDAPRRTSSPKDKPMSDGCRLLYVGRITPHKGLDELMNAYRSVAEVTDLDVTLDVIGEGPSKVTRKYRSWLKEWGLSEQVQLQGYVEHGRLRQFYQDCDVFVLPSHREGLPNVLMEAMASGAACIGTGVGAIPELLGDGRGIVVPPKRPNRLASAIIHLIRDGDRAYEIGERARDYVVQHHSFERVREKYKDMYSQMSCYG